MQIEKQLNDDAIAAIELVIREVRNVKAVLISTEDGFPVASHVQNDAQISRLSAMASSLSALSSLAGNESHLGTCRNLIIEAEFGILVIFQFQRGEDVLNMSVIAGEEVVVGQLLYFSKQAALMLHAT